MINSLNSPRFNREIFRMAIFEIIVKKFVDARQLKQPNDPKLLWTVFVDFQVKLFSRVHFMMPSIGFKEIAISHCMSANILLVPMHPSSVAGEENQLKAMDYKLRDDKREDYKMTSQRFEKWANIMFAHLRDKAYLGRAW